MTIQGWLRELRVRRAARARLRAERQLRKHGDRAERPASIRGEAHAQASRMHVQGGGGH